VSTETLIVFFLGMLVYAAFFVEDAPSPTYEEDEE